MTPVLILGDGDLTYSSSLCVTNPEYEITASVFLSEQELKNVYPDIEEQLRILNEKGFRVLFEIDATALCVDQHYDLVFFNFPHTGGKSAISKNRELLRKFFQSVAPVISEKGKVNVTLVVGQGGTPADGEKERLPGNSWQVQNAAAEAGFILTSVCDFVPPKAYCSSGYRGTDKGFLDTSKKGKTSKKGLTHTFVLNKFKQEESLLSFSSNSYFGQFMKKRQIDENSLQITYLTEHEEFDNMFRISNDDSCDLLAECKEEYGLRSKKDAYSDSTQEVQLYPPRYTHDLSVWISDRDLKQAVLQCLGLTFEQMVLKEVYRCPSTNRVSHCYSITYSHPHYALSKCCASTLAHRTLREYLALHLDLH